MNYQTDIVLDESGEKIYLKRLWSHLKWTERFKLKRDIKKFLKENVTGGKKVYAIGWGRNIPPAFYRKKMQLASINTESHVKTSPVNANEYDSKLSDYLEFYDLVSGRYVPNQNAKRFFKYLTRLNERCQDN